MGTRFTLFVSFIFVSSVLHTTVNGQGDGEATVPLQLSDAELNRLTSVLEETISGFGPADHGVAAPLANTSPVADGVISPNEYPNTVHYNFEDRENPGNPFPNLDTIEDEDDLIADLHLAHTDEFLFLGFEVQDEFLDLDEGVNAFTNDSVELFINADLEIDDFNPDTVGRNATGEGFQWVADAAGVATIEDGVAVDIDPSLIEFNNRSTSGISAVPAFETPPGEDEFFTAGLPNETGWVVEWQIPLSTLDTDSDEGFDVVPAKTGDVMLMNFAINDNDTEFAGGQDTHAMQWVVEEDPRSPFGGGENVWVVPLKLTEGVSVTPGDVNGDGECDAADIDAIAAAIKAGETNTRFDLNGDGNVDSDDRSFLISNIKKTFLGDSNLDGEFNSGDFVTVFTAGEYEDAVPENSGWSSGDWNGDMDFDSADFVSAFSEGAYEKGPMPPENANVPEPAALTVHMLVALVLLFLPLRRWKVTR